MQEDSSGFYISPDFISETNKHLSKIKPFSGTSPAGYKTDFLGVETDLEFVRLVYPQAYEIEKEARAISTRCPGIKTGELYFECGSLLAAIHDASEKEKFYMIELGGGWGSRVVSAHSILKNFKSSIKEFYIVVEAMKEHCGWIRKHMLRNGLDPQLHSIIQAAIWVDNTPKLFPVCAGVLGQGVEDNAPACVRKLNPKEAKESLLTLVKTGDLGITENFQAKHGSQTRDWAFVSSVTLRDILLPLERVDYMDVDIQGAEEHLISEGADILEEKVKRLHIGTHGLDMHTMLTDMFDSRGWQISAHIPPNGEYSTEWGDFTTSDGILSVVNKKIP